MTLWPASPWNSGKDLARAAVESMYVRSIPSLVTSRSRSV
jgi:hypothetical protein